MVKTRVKAFAFGVVICCLLSAVFLTGCSPEWKRKFVRKRKQSVQAAQPILVLQSDSQAAFPPAVRYQEHFAYWKSWHSELLGSLGQIRKRDLRYLSGTVGELRSLAELLKGERADRLREILSELNSLGESWSRTPEPWHPPSAVRTRLEQIRREIDRDFHFSKVKDSLVE